MYNRVQEDIKRVNRVWWMKKEDEKCNYAFRRNRKPCSCPLCSPSKVRKYKSKHQLLSDIVISDNLFDLEQ